MAANENDRPSGISEAAIEGAQQGEEAQRRPGHDATVKPAQIDTSEVEDDDDAEWRRAGGAKAADDASDD